jgi:hypothetical protein
LEALSTHLAHADAIKAHRAIWTLITGGDGTVQMLRVLEQIGDAEARAILQSLAKGCADAWLTQEAKASLSRLNSGKSEARP